MHNVEHVIGGSMQVARIRRKLQFISIKILLVKKDKSVVKYFKRPHEILCDGVETVSKFSYLGDRLNATGGCETAVAAKIRIGWLKFTECSEILKGKRFSFKMKGKVYESCVKSAMLY